MKITIEFSCEDLSMLIIYIIDIKINFISSFNVIISIGPITCFIMILEFDISENLSLKKL